MCSYFRVLLVIVVSIHDHAPHHFRWLERFRAPLSRRVRVVHSGTIYWQRRHATMCFVTDVCWMGSDSFPLDKYALHTHMPLDSSTAMFTDSARFRLAGRVSDSGYIRMALFRGNISIFMETFPKYKPTWFLIAIFYLKQNLSVVFFTLVNHLCSQIDKQEALAWLLQRPANMQAPFPPPERIDVSGAKGILWHHIGTIERLSRTLPHVDLP